MRFAALFAGLLLLCACQPVPHPFADDVPPPNSPILTPPDSAGVAVAAVAGAPAPAARDLAAAMAVALQKNDVPASATASNPGSYHLTGTAAAQDVGNGQLLVTIDWQMRDARGTAVSRQQTRLAIPATAWQQGGPALTALATQAAPYFAKSIETKAPRPLIGIGPVIAVRPVTGAPGDGGQALARAMENALRRAQVTLADQPGDKPTYLVDGKVEVARAANGQQRVKISWSLRRPDGGQIGEVNQENAVPAGSLDGPWGLTAYDIANAAAPGITALIAEMQRKEARS